MADVNQNIRSARTGTAVYFADGAPVVVQTVIYDHAQELMNANPQLICMRIHAHTRDEHGFPTLSEQPALVSTMEPAFDILTANNVLCIGRISSNGVRSHYFYAPARDEVIKKTVETFKAFPQYVVEVEIKNDPDWRFYRENLALLPEYERQKLLSIAWIESLKQQGTDLAIPRAADHRLKFADERGRSDFSSWATGEGFRILARQGDSQGASDGSRGEFAVNIVRDDLLGWMFLNSTLYQVVMETMRSGGKYLGGGCFVRKQK